MKTKKSEPIQTYAQLEALVDEAISKLRADQYSAMWCLRDLYSLSLRGSIAQTEYILANAERLIKHCISKPSVYYDLRKYINSRLPNSTT